MLNLQNEEKEMRIQQITETLRLFPYDGFRQESLTWYTDVEVLDGAMGNRQSYPEERINKMFRFLHTRGLCFYIEVLEEGNWIAIGDVTLQPDNLPIVIGEARYRGRGIGKIILQKMVEIAIRLNYDKIEVEEIYHANIASQKTFESLGFQKMNPTKDGFSYRLDLR